MLDVQRDYQLAEDAIQGFVKEGGSRSHAEKTFEDVTRPSREYWTRPKAHREDQFVKAEERSKNYQNWAIESLARKPLKGYELTDPDSKFEKKIAERRAQIGLDNFNNELKSFKGAPRRTPLPKKRDSDVSFLDKTKNAIHAFAEMGREQVDTINRITNINKNDTDFEQVKKMAAKVALAPNYAIAKAVSYVDRPLRGIIEQKKYIDAGIRAVAYSYGGPVAGVATDLILGRKPSEKEVQKLVKASIDEKHQKEINKHIGIEIQAFMARNNGAFPNDIQKERIVDQVRNKYIDDHRQEIEDEFDKKMGRMDKLGIAMDVINDAVQSQKDAEIQKIEGSYQPLSKMGQQVYAAGGGGGAAQFNAGFFAGFAHGKRWRSRSNFRYKKWFSMHYDRGNGGGRYAYRGKRSRFVNRYALRGYGRRFRSSLYNGKPDTFFRHIFWSVK